MPTRQLRAELMAKCEELKLSPAERVEYLANLLDAAAPTPELLALYESVATKLTARVPIAQLSNRKQFIEYKLKLAGKVGDASSSGEKADLIAELTEVKNNLDKLTRSYEKTFHESFSTSVVPVGAGAGAVGSNNAVTLEATTSLASPAAGHSSSAARGSRAAGNSAAAAFSPY